MCVTKAERGLHSLLPINRQMSNYSLGRRASACVMVAWQDKHHNPSFPELLLRDVQPLLCVHFASGLDQRAGKCDLLSP